MKRTKNDQYVEERCANCAQYDSSSYLAQKTGKHCLRDYPRTFTKEKCQIRFFKKGKWQDAFIPKRILSEDIPIDYFTQKEWIKMDKKEKLEALDALMKKQAKKATKKGSEMIVGTVNELPEEFRTIQQQPLDYPLFDRWSKGGLPKGGTTTFTGAPSVGKTSTALMLAAAYQRQGKVAMFVNYEGSFDEKWATTLGVNVYELYLVNPETLEDGLDAIEKATKEGILDVVILDSLDAAVPRGDLHKKGSSGKAGVERDIDDVNIALKPRILSQWFPRVSLAFRKHATSLIIIAQQRIQMSGIMAYQGMSGGNALKHSNILNITMSRKNNSKDLVINGNSMAYEMGLKVIKSKYAGLNEADELTTYFFHDQGFNKEFEYVSMALAGIRPNWPLSTNGVNSEFIDSEGCVQTIRGAKPATVYSNLIEKGLMFDFLKQIEMNENQS